MNFGELQTRLIYYCQRDGLTPPSTEAGRVVNAANKKLCMDSDFYWLELTSVPPAVGSYVLKRVPVTLSAPIYAVKYLYYPDDSRMNLIQQSNYEVLNGNLRLVNIETDGISSLTVGGWFVPPEMTASGDTTVLPVEVHEQIVQKAYIEWAAVTALNATSIQRIALYQTMVEEAVRFLKRYNTFEVGEREEYIPPERWISILT